MADLEKNLQASETDMTIFFRNLSQVSKEYPSDLKTAFFAFAKAAFYTPEEITDTVYANWEIWFQSYVKRLAEERITDAERAVQMNTVNPKYVLRNYIAQQIIDEADHGNYTLLNEIHDLLKKPYDEQPEHEQWFAKRPEWARHKVGCSMLSCSS